MKQSVFGLMNTIKYPQYILKLKLPHCHSAIKFDILERIDLVPLMVSFSESFNFSSSFPHLKICNNNSNLTGYGEDQME